MSPPHKLCQEQRHQLTTLERLLRILARGRRSVQCTRRHFAQYLLGRLEALSTGITMLSVLLQSLIAEVDPILHDIQGRGSEQGGPLTADLQANFQRTDVMRTRGARLMPAHDANLR